MILHLNYFFAVGWQMAGENNLGTWRCPVRCAARVRRLVDIFRCNVIDSIHGLLQLTFKENASERVEREDDWAMAILT